MLTYLRNFGVTPDFLIHHFYPEWAGPESDPLLLQASVNWALDAADLRQQLQDYLGPQSTNVELLCTENNNQTSPLGRQSTSLVCGLYLADSLSQLMKTEFNGYVWWDLRNGADASGSFDPTIYGWRTNGDEGLLIGLNARYPMFYTDKLMQYFARQGDTVLQATSDYLLLSAYAARKADGALALLVINKDATTNFHAQVTLANFNPSPTAMVRSYGIAQDEAARTNGLASAQNISTNSSSAGTNFSYSFPPYSVTLFTFAPAAPYLRTLQAPAGQFVFQLQGLRDTPYVIQTSPDLNPAHWTPVSTNTLTGSTLNFTNPIPADAGYRFWRALWQP
jgi:hypothetical protein